MELKRGVLSAHNRDVDGEKKKKSTTTTAVSTRFLRRDLVWRSLRALHAAYKVQVHDFVQYARDKYMFVKQQYSSVLQQ